MASTMAKILKRYYQSVLFGLAVGSFTAVEILNYYDKQSRNLNAGDSGLQCRNLELKLVQVLFRHGARTPLKLIPGLEETVWNKYELRYDLEHTKLQYELRNIKQQELPEETTVTRNLLRGGCRRGQMTIVGQQQTFDLGRELKKLYIDKLNFIGETYDPDTVFLRTTHVERAIESLRCVVAGMFTNIKEPIIFWTVPLAEEFLFPNWQTCKALRQYIKFCLQTGYRLPGYLDDLKKFSNMVGQPLLRNNFIDIYDDLNCRNAHNKAYPENMKSFMNTIERHALQQLSDSFLSPPQWTNGLVLPLSSGQMVETLYENMTSKVDKTKCKFYLYSVHDTSLITLFSVFDMKLDKWPPFAAYISLELYENKNGEHFVRMLYCGEVVTFKKCNKELIPLSRFGEIVTPLILQDVEKACQTRFQPPE